MEKTLNKNIRLLSKKELEKEGEQLSLQYEEWNDIFDILSMCRIHNLTELYTWSILSNRYKVESRIIKK